MIQPDLIVQDALRKTLLDIHANTALLDDVFAERPDSERLEIRDYLGAHEIPVKLGYPRDAGELPGLYCLLGSGREVNQTIGSRFAEGKQGEMWWEKVGTFMQVNLRVACWTLNANLTVWLANIALWGLLREREALNEQDLVEQQLSMSDFEPLPQWFPDFAYRRDIMLAANYTATVHVTIPPLREIEVTGTMDDIDDDKRVVVARLK